MKASQKIAVDGVYTLTVMGKPPDDGSEAAPFPMRLYRNRVRLGSSETVPTLTWRGPLKANDLIEADGERDLTLTVVEANDVGGPITAGAASA